MPDECEDRIEQILRSLAREPIQARDEFKQHLIGVLHQEQRRALQRRAYWHAIGALVQQMQRAPVWAAMAVLLLLAIVVTLIMCPGQRVLLTVHKGTASLVYYYPNSKHPLEQRQSGVSPVMEGTRVSLDEHSAASIQLFDNSRVELFPSTQITLERAQPRSLWRPQAVRINLSAGELRAEVVPLRSPEEVFEVETPAALISVHGTVFHTRVVTPQHVYVATYEGLVLVTLADPVQGNPRVEVPAGCAVDAIIGLPLLVHCGEPEGSTMSPEVSTPSTGGDVLAPHFPVAVEGYDQPNSTPPPVGDAPTLLPEVTGTPPATTLSPGNKPPVGQAATVTATITPAGANEPADSVTCTAPPPSATPIPVGTPPAPSIADVAIEFTGFPSLAGAEGNITYTLRVINRGPARAQNVVAMDLLPLQVSLVTASLAPEQEGNNLVWRLGALDAGAIRSWEVNVLVYPGAACQFANTVMVSSTTYDSDLSNNVAIASTAVTTAADLAVALAGIPPLIGSGSTITCTLSYTNAGPAVAQNVFIMTWLSDGLIFGGVVADSPPPDSGAVPGGTLALGGLVPVVWRIPALTAGASGRIVFTLTAQPGLLGPVTTTVAITANYSDPREDNNFLTSTANIVDPADLSIAYIAPDPVVAGKEIACTLAYTNDGPGAAREVLITMTLPAGVTVRELPGATAELLHDERLLTWFIPALPARMGGSLVLTLTVEQPVEGPLYGRIAISSVTPDSVPADNVSAWAINPLVAGLEVGHAVTPRLIVPYMPFTWTVYLTNAGTLSFPVRSLTVVPSLPPGFQPASGDGMAIGGAKKSWHNTTTLVPGEAISLPLNFIATGDVVPGLYTGQAVITAAFPGGLLTATEAVSVSLALPSVTINQRIGVASGGVRITVCLTNTGPSALDLVQLYEELTPPPALAGVSPAPDGEVSASALRWLDLTGPPPHGMGHNLGPGEALTVVLVLDVPYLSPHSACVESRAVVGELRDVYGNRSGGSTSRMVFCTGSRLYLPLVLRQP